MRGGYPRSILVLLAVVLIAHATAVVVAGPPRIEQDAAHYDDLARNLARGNGFAFSAEMQYPWQRDAAGSPQPTARRPVLFPLVVSGFYRLGLGPGAVLWLNVLLAGVTALSLYGLARELGLGARGGATAIVLYLLYPRFYEYTTQLLTESMDLALITAASWALLRSLRRRSFAEALAAGVLLGLATLTRPTTLFLPLALLPFLALRRPRALGLWGVFAVGFALAMAPWVARNAAVFGRFEPTFTSRGYNLFMGTYPPTRGASNMAEEGQPPELVASLRGKDEFAINRLYTEAAIENLKRHPGEVAKLVLAKAVLCWYQTRPSVNMFRPTFRSFVVMTPFLVLGIAGFVVLGRRRAPFAWYPVLVIAYFVAMHLASVATVRYNLPSVPFLVLGGAAAVETFWNRVRGANPA